MQLTPDALRTLARAIRATRPDEIGCAKCYEQLDLFVDKLIEGVPVDEAMPLVQAHLDMCMNCHEEFDALLEAIQAVS